MTIRAPKPEDAAAVAALYNHYVLHSTASFETEPLGAEQMRSRLESATARLVCERERAIVGFGYTHDWKERAAYRHTQEVTVYVAPTVRDSASAGGSSSGSSPNWAKAGREASTSYARPWANPPPC